MAEVFVFWVIGYLISVFLVERVTICPLVCKDYVFILLTWPVLIPMLLLTYLALYITRPR